MIIKNKQNNKLFLTVFHIEELISLTRGFINLRVSNKELYTSSFFYPQAES